MLFDYFDFSLRAFGAARFLSDHTTNYVCFVRSARLAFRAFRFSSHCHAHSARTARLCSAVPSRFCRLISPCVVCSGFAFALARSLRYVRPLAPRLSCFFWGTRLPLASLASSHRASSVQASHLRLPTLALCAPPRAAPFLLLLGHVAFPSRFCRLISPRAARSGFAFALARSLRYVRPLAPRLSCFFWACGFPLASLASSRGMSALLYLFRQPPLCKGRWHFRKKMTEGL